MSLNPISSQSLTVLFIYLFLYCEMGKKRKQETSGRALPEMKYTQPIDSGPVGRRHVARRCFGYVRAISSSSTLESVELERRGQVGVWNWKVV